MTIDNYWIVWCVGGGSPTVRHNTLMDARMEAERLARQNPGRRFAVLRLVGECHHASVVWHGSDLAPPSERDELGAPLDLPF